MDRRPEWDDWEQLGTDAAAGQQVVNNGGRSPRLSGQPTEMRMNWDRVQGNWKQFTGKVKKQWGKLTDDDTARINGNREQLEGELQAKYGYAKDKAKQEVDTWC